VKSFGQEAISHYPNSCGATLDLANFVKSKKFNKFHLYNEHIV